MKKTTHTTKRYQPKPRKLRSLDPREFENLIFDLMVLSGMTNVVWRTPGADGGRDIEGVIYERDFSGVQVEKKWFVECKRYAASVDWPTIYGKLSYADSLGADVLLLCTTSLFSPTATTNANNWNAARRSVAIRLWPLHEIELQLQQHPDLLLKYGLSDTPSIPGKSFLLLTLALSKAVSSHYSRLIFKGVQFDLMLHASQALPDLLLRRMEDIEQAGRTLPNVASTTPLPLENCEFIGDNFQIDEYGLHAFVAYLAALTKKPLRIEQQAKGSCRISTKHDLIELVQR
jgi:Restriction endonuclease